MCGLVGFASTNSQHKFKGIFAELMVLSSFRGMHSAGVAAMRNSTNPELVKVVGNPYDLFATKAFDGLSAAMKNIWIGHTRHATRGEITKDNAHPYVIGDIIGAHNGTLQNDWELKKEIVNTAAMAETDSSIMFAHIAENGIDTTIPKTKGAYAIVYYDRNAERLCFIKNDERTLWHCFSKDKTEIFWASEYTMLQYILIKRNGLELWEDEKGFTFFPFDDNCLYQFDVEELGGQKNKEIRLTDADELKGAEKYTTLVAAPFQGGSNTSKSDLLSNLQKANQQGQPIQLPAVTPKNEPEELTTTLGNGKSSTTSVEQPKTSQPQRPTLSLVTTNKDESSDSSLLYGPGGELLFENEFRQLTCNGCIWCSAKIEPENTPYVRWIEDFDDKGNCKDISVLCPDCSKKDSEAMQNLEFLTGQYGVVGELIVERDDLNDVLPPELTVKKKKGSK